MPRQSRIDAPGALHHVMIRGIERSEIFQDDKDRESFLDRLGGIILESYTPCYAWSLLSTEDLISWSKVPAVVKARAILCYPGVRRLGLTFVSVGKELGVSLSAVSKSIVRGQQALGKEAIEEYLLESQ